MTTYIFAIGGTGARVMRSLTMLLAAGCNGSTGNEIVPVILDYDTENGDKERTVQVLNRYKTLHDMIYNGITLSANQRTDSFFGTKMNRICDRRAVGAAVQTQFDPNSGFAAVIPPSATNITFASYLGYDQMVGGTLPTHELLTALYDDSPQHIQGTNIENPCAELRLNLEKGFKGCPNIGCIVTRHFADLPEYRNVLTCFTQGDRIVIVGSVFGGTGASGIPTLLDLLREDTRTQNAPIGVLAMMPYYKIDNQNNGAISSDTFIAKTKAAVSAYDLPNSVYSKANDIYFVGDNDMREPFAYSEGKREQKNHALFAEFAGAMCVLDFITGVPFIGRGQAHEFGLKDEAPVTPSVLPNNFVPITGSILEKHFYQRINNNEKERERYIYPLTKLVLFEKFFKEYVSVSGRPQRNDRYYDGCQLNQAEDFKSELNSFAEDLFGWLKELAKPARPVVLYHPEKVYDSFLEDKPLVTGRIIKIHAFLESDISQLLCDAFSRYGQESNWPPYYRFIRCAHDAFQGILDKITNF